MGASSSFLLDLPPRGSARLETAFETIGPNPLSAGLAEVTRWTADFLSASASWAALVLLLTPFPDQLKLPFALWTRIAVQQLIKQLWAIKMPIRTVGEYLKRWGFTPQKPLRKAYEQNPKAVKKWFDGQQRVT